MPSFISWKIKTADEMSLCPETKHPKKTTNTADLGFWHPDPALPKKKNKECFLSLIFYTAEMHHQESVFPLSFN